MSVHSASAGSDIAGPAARAYLLLTLTALLWAGNAVASKWAVGTVSPQVLTTLRWTIAFTLLLPLTWRGTLAERSVLMPRWRYILAMGAVGFTAWAGLIYLAIAHTTATNITLFQGVIPALVLLLNFALRGVRVTAGQAIGAGITLTGVITATTHGDWSVLRTFSFNTGDLLMLVDCLLFAGYTVALTARPAVSGPSFFTALAAAAAVTSLPPLAAEWATGHLVWPTPTGWALVVFVALGPTLLSQFWFIRGVELIGPNRAGLFVNLVPIFGAGLAVLLLGEPFGASQALALGLVLGGIGLAERSKPRIATGQAR